MSLPTFVIVGRVNKGKSSIVSALVEDETVPVGPEPGTTRAAREYLIRDGAEPPLPLVRIIDTPGFQQPEALAALLEARGTTASAREQALKDFVAGALGGQGDEFRDERRLLAPILEGASILYVVDASHPFRPSYEAEMRILQWTGRPRFALLNQTDPDGGAVHATEWSVALRQYFSVVRPFDAHRITIRDRLGLLTTLAELDDAMRTPLNAAVARLTALDLRRREETAQRIAAAICDLVGLQITERTPPEGLGVDDKAQLATRWQTAAVRRETEARREIEALYAHRRLERDEAALEPPLWERDLFASETFRLLGLSKAQIAGAAALAGAIGGAALDAVVAGHTLFAFAAIGGALGGGASLYSMRSTQEIAVAGIKIGAVETTVGPHRDPQYSWVLLDRALLHALAVAGRSHAVRAPLRVGSSKADDPQRHGVVGSAARGERAKLEKAFGALRAGRATTKTRDELAASISRILTALQADKT